VVSPHAIESLRSQTGDPVCQQLAVLLAKIRDATSGWSRLRSLPPAWRRCRRAGPGAGHWAGSGPGAFIKGLSAGCGAVIAA
jgi:hypothetical protein